MVLVLYFDYGYFNWAPLLIKSYAIHEPEIKIIIYGINLEKNQIKSLNKLNNVISVTSDDFTFNPNIASKWIYQIVCRKGQYVLDAMKHFKNEELFIITDIDMLLLRPLDELKSGMVNKDIGLIPVNKNKVLSTVIAVKNNSKAKSFMVEFNRRATSGFMEHKKDQPLLAQIFEERKNDTRFLEFDRRYVDHLSGNSSIFWSAYKSKYGNKKARYKVYLKKLKAMSK